MVLDPLPAWVRFNHANGEVRENARAQVPNLISANGCNWKCDPDSCHAHRSFKYLFDIFGCLFDPVRIHIRRYSETFLNPSYFDNPQALTQWIHRPRLWNWLPPATRMLVWNELIHACIGRSQYNLQINDSLAKEGRWNSFWGWGCYNQVLQDLAQVKSFFGNPVDPKTGSISYMQWYAGYAVPRCHAKEKHLANIRQVPLSMLRPWQDRN